MSGSCVASLFNPLLSFMANICVSSFPGANGWLPSITVRGTRTYVRIQDASVVMQALLVYVLRNNVRDLGEITYGTSK